MSNPYTLNMLYQNGIIDYVPTELLTTMPIAAFNPMQNQYINQATSGIMYQNYNLNDTFTSNLNLNTNIAHNNSNINHNMYGLKKTGQKGPLNMGIVNTTLNAFGFNEIGANANNQELRAWGFDNTLCSANNFVENIQNNTGLKALIGLGLLFIAGLSVKKCFTPAKKISNNTGFWKKLNPVNWFKKS